jgi:hypothetical protein
MTRFEFFRSLQSRFLAAKPILQCRVSARLRPACRLPADRQARPYKIPRGRGVSDEFWNAD